MDLSGALPDEVILEVFDEEWVQTVDYEHIPFRCRKCHEHGHLFKDCPLSKIEGFKLLQALNSMEGHKGGSSTPSYSQAVASRGKKPIETARGPSGERKRNIEEEWDLTKTREDNRTKENEK